MKIITSELPYKPNSIVYFFYEGKVGIGEVVELKVKITAERQEPEWKVKDLTTPNPSYLFLDHTRLSLSISKMEDIMEALMEEQIKLRKEDIFDVDKN